MYLCEQGITIASALTSVSMTITATVLAIAGLFGAGGGPAASDSVKDEEILKNS